MRILLAADGSPYSQTAVDSVLQRPWPEGTTIRVLTVAPDPYAFGTIEWYLPGQSLTEFHAEAKKEAQSIADAAAARLRERGMAVETFVREGDPRVEIVEEASDWNADLIVVGSHGYTGLRRLLLGSVAQHVVSHAQCSVEVARTREEAPAG